MYVEAPENGEGHCCIGCRVRSPGRGRREAGRAVGPATARSGTGSPSCRHSAGRTWPRPASHQTSVLSAASGQLWSRQRSHTPRRPARDREGGDFSSTGLVGTAPLQQVRAGARLCLLDPPGHQRSRPAGRVFEQRDSGCSLRTQSGPRTPTTARWAEAQESRTPKTGLGAREPQTRPFRRGRLTAPDVTPVGRPAGAPAAGRSEDTAETSMLLC